MILYEFFTLLFISLNLYNILTLKSMGDKKKHKDRDRS